MTALSDDELKDLAHSAYEEAMSFGLSVDTFLRYFKGIRNRALLAAQPAGAWLPTAENINALPEPLRDYVHQLEARCDPSGTVRENAQLKDVNKGLQIMYRNAADAAAQPAVQQPAEDDVFTALDMSPDTFRTEGGAVNVGKLRAAIRHPADYLPSTHWLVAAMDKGHYFCKKCNQFGLFNEIHNRLDGSECGYLASLCAAAPKGTT